GNQQVDPCRGVANDAIPEVGLGLAVMRDIRAWLTAGKPAGESAPGTDGNDDHQPDPVAAVRAVRVERGGEMPGKNPENPDPERNMQDAVVIFVSFPSDDFFHESPE